MPATMKQHGLDKLPTEEQMELAVELWQTLGLWREHETLTPTQLATLHRRSQELKDNPNIALTWEEIRSSIESPSF
jgi:putative addiction module component (TIGR02574 family)